MSFGCFVIASWEARGEGAQWSNLAEPISISNNISMLRVMIFLIIDTVLYYGLTRYFDLVKAGDWGISLPWYFCFTKSYWCPIQSEPIKTEKSKEQSLVEALPQNIEIGLCQQVERRASRLLCPGLAKESMNLVTLLTLLQ